MTERNEQLCHKIRPGPCSPQFFLFFWGGGGGWGWFGEYISQPLRCFFAAWSQAAPGSAPRTRSTQIACARTPQVGNRLRTWLKEVLGTLRVLGLGFRV